MGALVAAGLLLGPVGTPTAASAPVLPVRVEHEPVAAAPTPASSPTAAAPAQEEDDGLRVEATASYVVDPAAQAIHVSVETALTNELSNTSSGGYIRQPYFDSFFMSTPSEATNFVLEKGDGTPLSLDIEGTEDPYLNIANIDLRPDIYAGQSQTLRLSYDLPNQPPRSQGLSRANEAFITFPVFVYADPGLADVEVRVPKHYEVDSSGELELTDEGEEIVLRAENIPDPMNFFAFVVGTDDSKLVSREVDVDGSTLTVRGWPDDVEWADFVAAQVGAAKPVLTELTGLPWPERELEVLETVSPYAYGYAGWFDRMEHSISISDDLDPRVIFHELSHIWFNDRLFADRWVNEGYAEEYSTTALDQIGQPQDPPPAPDRAGEAAFALNDWSNPSFLDDSSFETEAYGYAASWFVVDQVATEIGMDKMREVVTAAESDTLTYLGDPEPETFNGAADWKRLLDLLEIVGGSQGATAVFDTWVVNDAQRAELAARAAAQGEYTALAERGGKWTPPLDVREDMAEWRFDATAESIPASLAVLDLRDQIVAELEGTGVSPRGLEEDYESASNVADVAEDAESTLEAASAYTAAADRYDEGAGLLGAIGLLGSGTDDRLDDAASSLESGDVSDSLSASRGVEQRMDDAARNGAIRLAVAAAVLLLVVAVPLLVRRRRRRAVVREAEQVARQAAVWGPTGQPAPPLLSRTGMPTSPPVAPGPPDAAWQPPAGGTQAPPPLPPSSPPTGQPPTPAGPPRSGPPSGPARPPSPPSGPAARPPSGPPALPPSGPARPPSTAPTGPPMAPSGPAARPPAGPPSSPPGGRPPRPIAPPITRGTAPPSGPPPAPPRDQPPPG